MPKIIERESTTTPSSKPIIYNPSSESTKQRIIVIGSGPAGMRFVEELLLLEPNSHITLFGNEPYQPYNRVQLSSLLSGDIERDEIDIPLPDKRKSPNFSYIISKIVDVNKEEKCVQDADGEIYYFDKLVFATGARAHQPNIEGINQTGAYTFRNLKDAEFLFSRKVRSRHIVVVGGGLLGIESAKGLLRFGTRVTVIQQGIRLMNRQLDETAGTLLKYKIESLGIRVITNSGVREIIGDGRVTGVRIRTGEEIMCDTVLLCAGIKPNMELARDSGIRVNRGIAIDERLETSVKDIYAIGECCEFKGQTYGLASPGFEQAAVLANVLSQDISRYQGSLTITQLKVLGENVSSLGEVNEIPWRAFQREIIFSDKKENTYRKIIVRRGHLIGAVGYGPWPEFLRLQECYKNNRRLWPWQQVLFRLTGQCWPEEEAENVKEWPESAVVCQCNNLSKGYLTKALSESPLKEAPSIKALQSCTKAGTVCGSCKPLLSQLLGEGQKLLKDKFWQILALSGLICSALIFFFLLKNPAQTSLSVQSVSWFEQIWNDKFWKQVSGFTLLGLAALGLIMSLRKRLNWQWLGNFQYWRLVHTALGLLCAALLVLHTGFHAGENFNQLLLINFLLVLGAGAISAVVIAGNHQLTPSHARKLRRYTTWSHIIISWPLPALLGIHILSVYFF